MCVECIRPTEERKRTHDAGDNAADGILTRQVRPGGHRGSVSLLRTGVVPRLIYKSSGNCPAMQAHARAPDASPLSAISALYVSRLRDDVIHPQVAAREVVRTARAIALLLAMERVPMRLVRRQLAAVRPLRDIGTARHVLRQLAPSGQRSVIGRLLESRQDQFHSEAGQVDACPQAARRFSGYQCGRAPAEGIQYHVTPFIPPLIDCNCSTVSNSRMPWRPVNSCT